MLSRRLLLSERAAPLHIEGKSAMLKVTRRLNADHPPLHKQKLPLTITNYKILPLEKSLHHPHHQLTIKPVWSSRR
jgi:hypothetical protein